MVAVVGTGRRRRWDVENQLNAPERVEMSFLWSLFERIAQEEIVLKTGGLVERTASAARVAPLVVDLLRAMVAKMAELDEAAV